MRDMSELSPRDQADGTWKLAVYSADHRHGTPVIPIRSVCIDSSTRQLTVPRSQRIKEVSGGTPSAESQPNIYPLSPMP